MAMQLRLASEGFYTSKVDGRRGPGSNAAFQSYAEAHGIPNTKDSILRRMHDTAVQARIELAPEVRREAVAAVKEVLADPYSADIQPMFAFPASANSVTVCGRFNAKNRYGAYVGFDWFYAVIVNSMGTHIPIGEPLTGSSAMEMCMMGASMTAGSQ